MCFINELVIVIIIFVIIVFKSLCQCKCCCEDKTGPCCRYLHVSVVVRCAMPVVCMCAGNEEEDSDLMMRSFSTYEDMYTAASIDSEVEVEESFVTDSQTSHKCSAVLRNKVSLGPWHSHSLCDI